MTEIKFVCREGERVIKNGITKYEEDDTLYLGGVVKTFRIWLEDVFGYEIGSDTIERLWEDAN